MDKIHEFDPQIYPRLLWVTYNCPTDVLREMFGEKAIDMSDDSNAETVNCLRTKPDVRGGVLIRFRNKSEMTIENIAHEAVHAALEIFDYVNARISSDNQEPFAYLVGWIADCCTKVKRGEAKCLLSFSSLMTFSIHRHLATAHHLAIFLFQNKIVA